ncbi:MAG: DUF6807 domain-containing protein [Planctomycetota bacterium]|jgi:hypothetical protein
MAAAKRVAVFVWIVSVLLPPAPGWTAEAAESGSVTRAKHSYDWRRTDSSLALLDHGRLVWQLNFDKKEGKPYFHPVCLTDGAELTWHRPPDHPWHYGLWFCWKYINGLNYWEEDRETGLSEGRSEIRHVDVRLHADHSADIVLNLGYHPPGAPAVLVEERRINVSVPDSRGLYRIDWAGRFTAGAADVLLDRTPIPGEKDGKSWGGYAGLSVRFAKNISDWQLADSEGRKDLDAHGQNARWIDFSGRSTEGRAAGIAVFDHPDNLRHPSPGFVIMNPKVPFGYFSPALLFNKPYTLPAGESLTLRYRILIHPGRADRNSLEKEWQSFLRTIDIQSGTKPRARPQSDQAIRRQLAKVRGPLQFNRQMSFAEAIDRIRNCVEPPLKIAVLWRDLYENADIDRTTPINMDEISGVSVGTALKLLLASVSGRYDLLGYIIDGGVITIATVESLPKNLKARVYDISDLL